MAGVSARRRFRRKGWVVSHDNDGLSGWMLLYGVDEVKHSVRLGFASGRDFSAYVWALFLGGRKPLAAVVRTG